MAAAIQVDFRIGGLAEVDKAFRSVEQSVARLEQSSGRRARVMVTDAQKTADAEVKAEARAAVDRIKERTKAERETDSLRAKSTKSALKALDDELKAYEKAEKAKITQTQQWARQREIIQTNSAKLAWKLAEEEVKAAEMSARKSSDARERWARGIGSTAGNSLRSIGSTATMLGGSLMALGGGFSIADIVQKKFAAERSAALLVNAVTSGGQIPQGANVNAIMARAGSISMATGMDKSDIVGGALAYSRSARGGDFNGAMNNMAFFAKMSKVTGASINDIASSAGILQSQNAALGKDPEKMRQMLLNSYAQTKSGSVSMTDAAKQFGTLGSTRGFYSGDEGKTQMTLMGLGQIAASGGQSGDIGTYIKDLSIEAGSKRRAKGDFVGLEAMGVKYNKNGQMDSPEQMIGAVLKSTGGDQSKIQQIFGNRGSVLFGELGKSFRDAGGGDAGVSAVQSQIKGVTQSSMNSQELTQQFEQSMGNSAERFARATQTISNMIEGKLTPYLEAFANKLPELMPKIEAVIDAFGGLASAFMDHPIAGIGAIIVAKVGADIAAAQVGEAIKSIIAKSLGGGGAAGAGAGGGVGGAVVGLAAVGITAAAVVKSVGDLKDDQSAGSNLAKDVRSGKVSATDAQKMLDSAKSGGFGDVLPGVARTLGVGGAIDAVAGTNVDKRGAEANQKLSLTRNQKEIEDAIAESVKRGVARGMDASNAANRKGPMSSPGRDGPP